MWMGFERSGGQSGAREVPEARTLRIFGLLEAPGETFDRYVGDLGGLGTLLGVLGGRFGFDFGSKIDVNTGTADFLETMLSPAWEHRFWRSEW